MIPPEQLRFTLALLHEARLRGTGERPSIFADGLWFARLARALRHKAVECRASQWFPIFPNRLAVARAFCHRGRTQREHHQQCHKSEALHLRSPFKDRFAEYIVSAVSRPRPDGCLVL